MNQKQVDLFYKNILLLTGAIELAGGNSANVLKDQQKLIEILSRNGLELSAMLHPCIGD